MKALRFEKQQLLLTQHELSPQPNDAVVRVTLAGICNTDLEIVRGYANFQGTLGHEFVGIVTAAPDTELIGKRVVGEINAGCGRCDWCLRHDPRHCRERSVLGIRARDGAFAQYLALPAENLRVVPSTVTDYQAVFTEPLAAACEILDQVSLKVEHQVAVIGDGKLGQLIARVLATTGCRLTLIGKYPDKLALARAAGIETISLPDVDTAAPQFDYVIEASGAAAGFHLALDIVKARGTIVLKSTFHERVILDTWRIVVDEITVIGSRCGRFESALDLLASGQIKVEPLIAAEYSLDDGLLAFEHAKRKGTLKILLRMDG